MGYPNFGKVKTIVLPLLNTTDDGMTIEEYRNATGIDLSKFIVLHQDKTIGFVTNGFILGCVTKDFMDVYGYNYYGTNYVPPTSVSKKGYEAGVTDGELDILFDNGFSGLETNGGFKFKIDKDSPFELGNIRIKCEEL